MNTIYLIRGIPGSGKTTLADTLKATLPSSRMVAADDYFTTDGKYEFDASSLGYAHNWCLSVTQGWVFREIPNIIIHNTFTTEKELKPYLDIAEENNYRVVSLIVEGRHGNKSVHNVPEKNIEKMKNRFSIKL